MKPTYVDKNGYARFADTGTLVHCWIAGKVRGQRLLPWERVHHINGIKLDNRPSNLFVCEQREHELIHQGRYIPVDTPTNNGVYVVHKGKVACFN